MAFRFRRSMNLGKGLRLNVTKRGVGMSFGKRGLRSSIHSTGSRTNTIGIPGTGLSYVDRSYGKKKKSSGRKHSAERKYSSGEQKRPENALVVEKYNNYIYSITNVHQETLEAIDWQKIYNTPAPFPQNEMGPKQKEAEERYNQYRPSLMERIFKNLATKKRNKLKKAIEQGKKTDEAKYKKWENLTELAANLLDGEPEAYRQVVKKSHKFDNMRERSTLNVVSQKTVKMDVQVETKDIVPKKNVQLTKTGKVSKRKMGKKDYYGIVKAFVSSHAIWTARSLFASLPVDTCVINMTETHINTATGHYDRRVLLTVSFDRETLEQLNVARIDPADALENFEHHMDFLKTKGFRSVEPIDLNHIK